MDFSDKQQIEKDLTELPYKIKLIQDSMVILKQEYSTAKAIYENKVAEIIMTMKVSDPSMTQTDLKAQSTIGSHTERLNMIMCESKYRKSQNEYTYLKDLFEVAKERSYTYRSEVKQGY